MKLLLLVLSLIVNPYAREGISLDGKWQAIVDQYDTGTGKKLFLDRQPSSKTEFLEFSWSGGLELDVPGDWNHQDESLRWYEGTARSPLSRPMSPASSWKGTTSLLSK